MPGFNQIRAMKKRPTQNTPLARRLARLYELAYQQHFPGGIKNAKINRDQLAITAYRDCGAWVWSLFVIDSTAGYPRAFGSPYPARECVKDRTKIEAGWLVPAFDT